jgi:hypothetical protein
MDKDKLVKKIAEEYFFKGKQLSSAEKMLIENSSYAPLLKSKDNSKFNSLIENTLNVEQEKFKPTLRKRRFTIHNYNKVAINELVDDIETKYKLNLFNNFSGKFSNIDLEDLKKFIVNYANTQVYDDDTENLLKELAERDSVSSILYKLYSLQ